MRKNVNDVICRCEEIAEAEIREAIRNFGLTTVDEIKRLTRAAMGLCQGRSCEPTIRRILAEETNKKVSEILPLTRRPPIRPIKIESLAEKWEGE